MVLTRQQMRANGMVLACPQMRTMDMVLTRQQVRATDMQTTVLLRLPPELIVAIFKLASPSGITDKVRSPVRLSQVCRSWRIFVHATPSLWTQLTLSEKKVCSIIRRRTYERALVRDTNRQINRDIKALRVYLERSKDLLLTLIIRQSYAVDAYTERERPKYFDKFRNSFVPALVAYIKRCKLLVVMPRLNENRTIFTNTTPESKAIFEAINNSSNLEVLRITEQWIFGPHFSGKLVNRLSKLTFENYEVFHDVFMSLDTIPLRYLSIGGRIPWLKFFQVVERFNKLEVLVIVGAGGQIIGNSEEMRADYSNIDRKRRPITTLRELHVSLPSSDGWSADSNNTVSPWTILDFLDLPALEKLDLHVPSKPSERSTAKLQAFLHRSLHLRSLRVYSTCGLAFVQGLLAVSPGLTRLDVAAASFDADRDEGPDVVQLLEDMAELRRCQCAISTFSDDPQDVHDQKNILLSHKHPQLCPQLRHFTMDLQNLEVGTISMDTMAKFIAARSSSVCAECDPCITRGLYGPIVTHDEATAGHQRRSPMHQCARGRRAPVFEAEFTGATGQTIDYLQHPDIASCCKGAHGFRLFVNNKLLSS